MQKAKGRTTISYGKEHADNWTFKLELCMGLNAKFNLSMEWTKAMDPIELSGYEKNESRYKNHWLEGTQSNSRTFFYNSSSLKHPGHDLI